MKILLSFLCLCLLTGCMYDPFRPTALKLADELERKTEMRVIHSEFKGGNWELFITPAKFDITTVEGYEFTTSHVLFYVLIRKAALAEYVKAEIQTDLDAFHKWSEENTELEVLFPPFPLWVTPNHWSEEDGQKILD